jgi:UDP-N-acetylglucosamine 2-epimerase (non-hydrolysing)
MPEEVNRKLADAIATIHFAPTKLAVMNLLFEGVSHKSIHLTGNTIVDAVSRYKKHAIKKGEELLSNLGLNKNEFILLTLHRAENTDNQARLRNILLALHELSQRYKIVFPLHPRTKGAIVKYDLTKYLQRIKVTEPLGYFDFLGLLANSKVVLTDSGGVQEEAFTLKIPIVTLRYNTERPETTMYNLNRLAGADRKAIIKLTLQQIEYAEKIRMINIKNPLGDGHAGEKIAKLLKNIIEKGIIIKEPDLRETPVLIPMLCYKEKLNENFEQIIGFTKIGKPTFSHNEFQRSLVRLKKKIDEILYLF